MSGLPVKAPTWFWTNSVRLATSLNSKCSCGSVPHAHLSSWSWDSVAATLSARVTHGLRLALRDVEPERLEALQVALTHQIRRRRLQTPTPMLELREKLVRSPTRDHGVNKVIDEGTSVPQDGIEFTIPDSFSGTVPKSLLGAVRRLHINCGHPSNADLERVCRLAGGSQEACMLINGLHCTTCRRMQAPKLARPGHIRHTIGQFNEVVMADLR